MKWIEKMGRLGIAAAFVWGLFIYATTPRAQERQPSIRKANRLQGTGLGKTLELAKHKALGDLCVSVGYRTRVINSEKTTYSSRKTNHGENIQEQNTHYTTQKRLDSGPCVFPGLKDSEFLGNLILWQCSTTADSLFQCTATMDTREFRTFMASRFVTIQVTVNVPDEKLKEVLYRKSLSLANEEVYIPVEPSAGQTTPCYLDVVGNVVTVGEGYYGLTKELEMTVYWKMCCQIEHRAQVIWVKKGRCTSGRREASQVHEVLRNKLDQELIPD